MLLKLGCNTSRHAFLAIYQGRQGASCQNLNMRSQKSSNFYFQTPKSFKFRPAIHLYSVALILSVMYVPILFSS